jgi:hypothetical protein
MKLANGRMWWQQRCNIYMDDIKIKIVEILLNTKQRLDECWETVNPS